MHPILFKLGDFTVYSYGAAMLASWVIAYALLLKAANALDVPADLASQLGFFTLTGGLVGGRGGFMLVNLRDGLRLSDFFSLSTGFLFTTALLGAVLAAIIGAKWIRRPVWTALDLIIPAMAGLWAVGNAGCFLAGCCVGNPTSGPFGVSFTADVTPLELRGVHVHPVQLYALSVEAVVIALWFLWSKAAPGARFLSAIATLLLMKVAFASTGIAGGNSVVAVYGYTTLAAIAVVLGLLVGRRAATT